MIVAVTDELKCYSATPRLDAELLITAVIDQPRTQLFAHPERELTAAEEKKLTKCVKRRVAGEPVAYILGHKEFWSLDLQVTPDVLIPRPETEMLVEWTLDNLPAQERLRIADLGTGCGAIAIALAYERPAWTIDAIDNSKKALNVAKRNADWHRTSNVNFYCGEWCQALPAKKYRAILGNPPYIASADAHLQNLSYEPQAALNGGGDGLQAIEIIIKEAQHYLLPQGWLVLEHGYDQSEQIVALMKKNNYRDVKDHPDLAHRPRMAVGRKRD